MKKIVLFLIIVLIGKFSFCQNDTANVQQLWDMSLEELMNIKVSGVSRYFQNISDVPNSVIVVDKNMIERRGYTDISDVLKDIIGFDVIDNAGQFGEFISLRGVQGNDRFLVLINGHKINPPSGTHISLGNSLSIKYAERIEIIYGPASAVYGADAFSGIINIIYPQNFEEKKHILQQILIMAT